MKRQRGRGRRPGGGHQHNNYNNPNRQLESTGPDNTKVRGSASLVFERYQQYARDAASSGDRVLSENYSQHADHYFRVWRAMQPAMPPPQPDRFANDADFEGDEDFGQDSESADENEVVSAPPEREQYGVEGQQEREPRTFDRDGGDARRRRGRRNRFRPTGDGAPDSEGAEQENRAETEPSRREREDDGGFRRDRDIRRERPPREERRPRDSEEGRDSGPEGFSSGPKPAFLRGD